jgi:hypothetical protein
MAVSVSPGLYFLRWTRFLPRALAWKFDKFDEQTWINEPPIRAVLYSPCGATVIGLYVTMTVVGATALGS